MSIISLYCLARGVLKFLKRNFGHVYLQNGCDPEKLYRFRARFGRVAFVWSTSFGDSPFVCRLEENGEVVIDGKQYPGYNQQWGEWTWRYFYPMGFPLENLIVGGFWK